MENSVATLKFANAYAIGTLTYTTSSTDEYYYISFTKLVIARVTTNSYRAEAGDWYIKVGSNKIWSNSSSFTITGTTAHTFTFSNLVNKVSKTHSSQSVTLALRTNTTVLSVPAKTSYTISYSGNGGQGSLGTQTKWYGESLALRANGYTRENHSFVKWNTAANGSGTSYGGASGGGTYTANAKATLYAQWSQIYASPQVSITSSYRCDSSGEPDDEGKYAAVECTFKLWKTANPIEVDYDDSLDEYMLYCTVSRQNETTPRSDVVQYADKAASPASNQFPSTLSESGNWLEGTCKFVVNADLKTDNTYPITATVYDTQGGGSGLSDGYGTKAATIGTAFYTMDVLAGGHGICFGGVAKDEVFESDFNIVRIVNGQSNTDTFFKAVRNSGNDTRSINFGVGSGAHNAGIWDDALGKWLIYCDDSTSPANVYIYDPLGAAYVNMGLQYTTTVSDVLTAGSGVTISSVAYAQYGKVATVRITFTYSSNISSGNITNITLATMKSGKIPKVLAPFTTGSDGPVMTGYIGTGGAVVLSATAASISANTTLNICSTYVVA